VAEALTCVGALGRERWGRERSWRREVEGREVGECEAVVDAFPRREIAAGGLKAADAA